MLFLKRPKYREFDYQPRYYTPEEDQVEKRKKRLKFRYNRTVKKKGGKMYTYLVLFVAIIIFYFWLNGI